MTTSTQFAGNVFSLVKKSFSFESGALALITAPGAYSLERLISLLTDGIDIKLLVMPLVSFGVLTVAYVFVSLFDFYTGLKAAKKEAIKENGTAKGYMKSDKLWSSVWKYLGVILIGSILTVFTLLFVIMSLDTLAGIFRVGIVLFFLVVISFDLHSIGENQERRFGKKPAFYEFIDTVSLAVRTRIIDKIKNPF